MTPITSNMRGLHSPRIPHPPRTLPGDRDPLTGYLIRAARWDDSAGKWTLEVATGDDGNPL